MSERVGQLWQGVRRWRSGTSDRPPSVNPDLPEGDLRRIRKLVDEIIDARGGEVAARRRARMLGVTYADFSAVGQQRFFDLLAAEYGNDRQAVDAAIDTVIHAATSNDRRAAEADLRSVLVPRRERLLRRFVGLEGGLSFLVQLREDIRDLVRADVGNDEGLRALDSELRSILDRWFDVGLLTLTQITWSTSAAFLEKLIQYEAVHAIRSWNDLKVRLGPGRRCYAYIHPAMPDDPLIFVEVALTEGMAAAVTPLIEASDGPPRTDV
ncbi:MAG: malonyl-CoA decarboxylase, partial [Acidimicrobiia bacterium]|nr:malonyl-CoA decarboxylase [Acidimicrobiia bacterium]